MQPLVACGMYAFNPQLKACWKELLENLPQHIPGAEQQPRNAQLGQCRISFQCDDSVYRNDALLLGHTCGYPYIKKWRNSHRPVVVPVFDIDGCSDINYCSWLISRREDCRTTLEDYRNSKAVINNSDSNSGMNAFRHTLRDLHQDGRFFSEVIVSGSHLDSMRCVARGDSDLAAIDAVTWHHFLAQEPETVAALKVIDSTVASPALPFIQHQDASHSRESMAFALNSALEAAPSLTRETLRLRSFQLVTDADYEITSQLETDAIQSGYPALA